MTAGNQQTQERKMRFLLPFAIYKMRKNMSLQMIHLYQRKSETIGKGFGKGNNL